MEAAMSITCENQRPVVASDFMLVVGIYVLYGLSYFTLFPALAGLIIAYVKLGDCHPVMQSHYRFQIRTFWIGVLYVVTAIPLCFVLIGFPLLLWWTIWSFVRIIKGFLLALEREPIANPRSWLFG
jgi:uncharacterized membrane protein